MLKNYFKIAWRSMLKNKTAAAINIFGLSAGLAACMLLVLYVVHETSYDTFQKNKDNLFLVGTTFIKEGKENNTAGTPAILGQTMQQEFPEVMGSTKILQIFTEDKTLLRYTPDNSAPRTFYEERGYIADSMYFNLFTYNFVEGNPSQALNNPRSVVLSEEIAHKMFGNQPALNKRILISSNLNGGDADFLVTGVFKPQSTPSHIDGRFFISYTGSAIEGYVKEQGRNFANNNMFFTYLFLKDGLDAVALNKKFPAFMKKYAGEDLKQAGFDKRQFLVPVPDIHLRSDIENTGTPSGSLTYLYILGSIAVFILLIACINFMNLATARSSKRSAEVGVRKVLGAEKSGLIKQFLGESLLMAIIAFIAAMILVKLFVPFFALIAGQPITFSFNTDYTLVIYFFVLSIITGLLAGTYPAFYLSSFKPVKVLKGRFSNTLAAVTVRKGLVVFQFVISVALIISATVIQKQMRFLRSKDLGFAKDQQLIIPLRSEKAKLAYSVLKNEIARNKEVLSVGASVYYPGIFNPEDNNFYRQGQAVAQARHTRTNRIDNTLLKTLDIKLSAGRLFSPEFTADSSGAIILNEKAVADIGFESPQKSVGQKIFFNFNGQPIERTIVGVVKDFNFEDLQQPITPYAFTLNESNNFNYLIVHGSTNSLQSTIAFVEDVWKKQVQNEPFEYSFLDADFQKNYASQQKLSSMVSYFTIIAILISCLGLFALATFSAEQRIKEIGVRKVLGASAKSIVALLSKDFLKLVLIASVIASPIAWFIMRKWLNGFAYRIDLGWSVFAFTIGLAVLIALMTISFQAIRAALANPVKSLRTE